MSVINSQPLIGASGNQGYFLDRSLRFRQSASPSLTRTPSVSGSQTTYTYSAWIKRGLLASANYVSLWASEASGANYTALVYYADAFYWSTNATVLTSAAVYRDTSAWYHIVLQVDTTQATDANRVRIYVNGTQVTLSGSYPTQNQALQINTSSFTQKLGFSAGFGQYFDGYMAEFNFIDGQALTPSSFGETSASTGVWIPKKYTGTYGTNGFYLDFKDNSALTTSSNAGLGKDNSGNGNYLVTNNISITSGSTYDSMTDVPTLTSPTAANYCVMNPLRNINTTITSANLNVESPSSTCGVAGTFAVNTGKWYWEVNCISNGTNTTQGVPHIGIIASDESSLDGSATNMYLYRSNGDLYTGAGYGQTGLATYTNGDVISVAYDAGANSLQFYKNNTAVGTPISTTTNKLYQPYWLVSYVSVNSSAAYNFGQRPFAYTPPTGFVALNTFNLPTPTIGATASSQANDYFDATTYTTTGTTQAVVNSGGMQPDFVWIKPRSSVATNLLFDSIRGVTKYLESNSTNAETTDTTNFFNSFNSNGFSQGTGNYANGTTVVAWQWRANGTGVTNTAGSITSTVSANTTAGFSIVTYTGTGANATVGHGLGVAPRMIIIKNLGDVSNWPVWHSSLLGNSYYLYFNKTDAQSNVNAMWNNTAPTSTVFSLGTSTDSNDTRAMVAYCFAEVAGYSRFGSYTGNGSSDGTFVFTGFRPAFVMLKRTDSTGNWNMYDDSRSPTNAAEKILYANLNGAEDSWPSGTGIDILSNGFKLRRAESDHNASGGTFIYMAFAESPFKYSVAR